VRHHIAITPSATAAVINTAERLEQIRELWAAHTTSACAMNESDVEVGRRGAKI
jgi:hypothetical protein